MKRMSWLVASAVAVSLFLPPLEARAAGDEAATIAAATEILQENLADENSGIPPSVLDKAHGLVVIPNVFDVAVGAEGYSSQGVMMVRSTEGRWSNPAFVTLSGRSLARGQGTDPIDVILLFMTRKSVDALSRGKVTLSDLSVAAGPTGRGVLRTGAISPPEAEILTYTHTRTEIAGIALPEDSLRFDSRANESFYGSAKITPATIFTEQRRGVPIAAAKLKCVLASLTKEEQACA